MLYPSELQARGWLPEGSEEVECTSLVRFYRRMGADASGAGAGRDSSGMQALFAAMSVYVELLRLPSSLGFARDKSGSLRMTPRPCTRAFRLEGGAHAQTEMTVPQQLTSGVILDLPGQFFDFFGFFQHGQRKHSGGIGFFHLRL